MGGIRISIAPLPCGFGFGIDSPFHSFAKVTLFGECRNRRKGDFGEQNRHLKIVDLMINIMFNDRYCYIHDGFDT